jgi:hypothetical protein
MKGGKMFDLEKAVANWRRQMLAAGIKAPAPLDELEIHLREEIERQMKSGLTEAQAFVFATQQMGEAGLLKNEFQKVRTRNWNLPLAWAAWGTFLISFFLPAYEDWHGWRCAVVSAEWEFIPGFFARASWGDIHLALLTLANLLMIASVFWLPKGSGNARSLKWLRGSSFAALALVWSFIILLFTPIYGNGVTPGLRIGCYVWCGSFLLLCLSTFPLPERKRQYVRP